MANKKKKSKKITFYVVTPVKNEENNLPRLAKCITHQTKKPDLWLIVNDGSNDGTERIIKDLVSHYNWITSIDVKKRNNLKFVSRPAYINDLGLQYIVDNKKYESKHSRDIVICNCDADVEFSKTTTEKVCRAFSSTKKLGILGGEIFEANNGEWQPLTKNLPREFVRGAFRSVRLKCYEDIGGIEPVRSWLIIGHMKARKKGWQVKTENNLPIYHHRKKGAWEGSAIKDQANAGFSAAYTGSDILLVIIRALWKMISVKPLLFGGMGFLYGYMQNRLVIRKFYPDSELRSYIKNHDRQLFLRGQFRW